MLKIETIQVGEYTAQTLMVGEAHPNMLIMLCKNGYIMCGYLNIQLADEEGDTAVIISGADFEDLLRNPVKAVTSKAAALGVTVGMTGAEVVAKFSA